MLSPGCRLLYTNKKHLKDDIAKQKRQFLIAVPRLYDVIYQGMCPRNRGDGGGRSADEVCNGKEPEEPLKEPAVGVAEVVCTLTCAPLVFLTVIGSHTRFY